MRYVSPDTVLGRPEGFDQGIVASAIWERTREWFGGGRFWSAVLVLLLTISVSKSTITAHWVDGIDVVLPVAVIAALLMSLLALLPVLEPLALGVGALLTPVVAAVAAGPRMHANHPSDVVGLPLIGVWWTRIQDGSAVNDQSFFLFLICALMWISGGWLAWCVLRWRRPMLGLMPAAAAFATNVLNIPGDQNGYVLALLVLTLALLLWSNYTGSIVNAGRANVKLTGDAKWDFWESGLVAMAALIVLGIMLPPISVGDKTVGLESSVFTSWAQLQSRLSNPNLFTSTSGSHGVTGFADDVKLSGALKRSAEPVFEWTQKQAYGGPKYFRGVDVTVTLGNEWRSAGSGGFQEVIAANAYPEYQESYEKLGLATIDITMRAPPIGFTSVMFYPGQMFKIDRATIASQVPLGGQYDLSLQTIDRLDGVKNPSGTYAVTAEYSTATIADLQGAGTEYPGWVTPFKSLPPIGYRSPAVLSQIHAQALKVVNDANATNPYDMAAAIERWLRDPKNFTYSLDIVPPRGVDPIQWFLFDSRTGYCEFFATAMGDMLRSLGIPTRLVNGFGAGQFNSQTESNVVRAADAHTWVEVYFPTYGWIPFEPTADDLGLYQPITRGATGSNLCLRDENCTDPGSIQPGPVGSLVPTPKSRPGLEGPNVSVGGGGFSVASVSGSLWTKAIGVLVALLLLLLVAALRYLRPGTVTLVWRRMLVLAHLAGAERRPGETPLELGRRLQRTFPEAAGPMHDLTGAFVVAAYAPPEEASQQRSTVLEAWVALRPMLLRRVLARLKPGRI